MPAIRPIVRNMHQLDIIVPARNEAESLPELVRRVDTTLTQAGISYRLIVVDDRSTDNTAAVIQKLTSSYPIQYLRKLGQLGKAYAILEGLAASTAPALAMLDADLEYPPEALGEMFRLLDQHGLVVGNRLKTHASPLLRLASQANTFIFGKLILGFDCDVQSGLKMFRREVFIHLDEALVGAWSIDMPLLHTTQELGLTIGKVNIHFTNRAAGKSKLKSEFFQAVRQIGGGAIRLKFTSPRTITLLPTNSKSSLGAGVVHKRKRFITHSRLPHHLSALETLHAWQKACLLLVTLVIGGGLYLSPLTTAIVVVGILTTVYFADVLFNLFLVLKSLHFPPELRFSPEQLGRLQPDKLPLYTILCPLYREAHVLPQFLQAIAALDWPKNRLEVLLLLEEDDAATIAAAKVANLPSYICSVIVPHSYPKTKPKACNYGLQLATGEYIVIYDAEDRPDPSQLKMAYLGFQKSALNVGCLQAKLNYYNPHQNLLTRLFTAEYSLWFDVVLPGLQSVNTAIPLGGTSNHFKTSILRTLQGWDAFNVTEDCDLGARLFKLGYTTAIIDSTTLEEANSHLGNWLRQRSRWIKGYIQTYLVHNRNPLRFIKDHGIHAFIFQLVVGGKIAFMLINPLLWLTTIAYFTLYAFVGPTIESLYPTWIFYMAVTSLVFGNFLFLYYYMIGAAKRSHWSIIKYVFLVPFYWIAVSLAAYKAIYQLVVKPHYWEKTHHGLDVKAAVVTQARVQIATNFGWVGGWARPSLISGGLLVLASLVANLFGFLFNAYLGRASGVSVAEFGLISLFGSLLSLTQIPASALARTVTYRSAYLLGKHKEVVRRFWKYVQGKTLAFSIMATGGWLVATPFLQRLFHTPNYSPFLLFSPILVIGALAAVNFGYLSGNQKFGILALMAVLEAVSKLVFTVILVQLGLPQYVYLAIPASMAISLGVGYLAARSLPAKTAVLDTKTVLYFPWRFYITSVLSSLSSIAFLSMDIVLAKIYLPAEAAGQYALLSLVGKMVYLLGSLFSQFITPVVSRAEGAGTNSVNTFNRLLLVSTLASLAGFVAVGLFGPVTAPLLFGAKTLPIVNLLPWYALAIVAFTIASNIVGYHQIRKHYIFPVVGFAMAGVQLVALTLIHDNVSTFAFLMLILCSTYLLLVVGLHVFYEELLTFLRNFLDFVGLFGSWSNVAPDTTGSKLRILVFNWRDTRHVWAGGAEVYVHELAKRWAAAGHQVTIFCGNDGHHPRNEVIDGVQIIRRGGFYSVYIWAFLYYTLKFRGLFDLVIDSENGIPFFAKLYAKVPTFLLIYHVHQEVFQKYLVFPLSSVARFMESKMIPAVYGRGKVITISESTKSDIVRHNLALEENILIIYPGIDADQFVPSKKTNHPSFIYLGRLKPYKNVDVALKAFATVHAKRPDAIFTVAGEGESKEGLIKLSQKLGIDSAVKFTGKVPEIEKATLLGSHWAAIQPSSVEGWGITVIEANACGTPVVASNVPGLRDSVLNLRTGYLVACGDENGFADRILKLIEDKPLRLQMGKYAVAWAEKFSWDNSAKQFLFMVEGSLKQSNARLSRIQVFINKAASIF